MVPGHKAGVAADGELRAAFGDRAFALDLPTLIEGVDGPGSPYERALQLAAEAWGARRTWFLTNGASQGNLAACLAIARRGERVVVQRTVHGSTIDGLVLAGLRPTFVAPEVDADLGVAHCVRPAALDAALAADPGAAAAIVVSPTYHGAIADVRGLARVAHAHGVPLVVDEAWGAHLAFSDALGEHALAAGADLVVSSTHKHAGSLSQTAMLHLGGGFDEAAIDDALRLVSSTSPSSLLLASLDAARRRAVVHGARLLERQIADLAALRARIRAIGGLEVLDSRAVGSFGIAGIDPLRLCVDVRATGFSGRDFGRVMRRHDDVHVELCGEHVLVAVFGLGEDVAVNGAPLVRSLGRACASLGAHPRRGVRRERPGRPYAWGPAALSPRAAFLAPRDQVPFAAADGRIAAECLASYPPGIPDVIPGERFSLSTLARLRRTVAAGGVVRGATDPTLQTLLVVAEPALSAAA